MSISTANFEIVNNSSEKAAKTAAENHVSGKNQVVEKRRESFLSALMRVLSSVSF
jgi:hypothetical protein